MQLLEVVVGVVFLCFESGLDESADGFGFAKVVLCLKRIDGSSVVGVESGLVFLSSGHGCRVDRGTYVSRGSTGVVIIGGVFRRVSKCRIPNGKTSIKVVRFRADKKIREAN